MENSWFDLDELIEQCHNLLDVGIVDNALALLQGYADVYKDELEFQLLIASVYSSLDRLKDAINHLRYAYRIDRNDLDTLLAIFYAFSQAGKVKKGAKYLFRAYKFYPKEDDVIIALIWYNLELAQFGSVVELFEAHKQEIGLDIEALRNVAISYERLGFINKALNCYKTALELDPDDYDLRDLLADYYMNVNSPGEAINLYESYLKKSQNNIRMMSRLVSCYSELDKNDKAEEICSEIISIYPNSPVGYVDLAYVNINKKNYEKALKLAEQALDVAPLDAEAVRVKAVAYDKLKDYDTAGKYYEKAISITAENPELLRDYYSFLKSVEDYKRMEDVVNDVIKLTYPDSLEDYWFLAEFYKEQNQDLKAFHFFRKAYSCVPGERDFFIIMADILFKRGHIKTAVPILKNYMDTKGWGRSIEELTSKENLRDKITQEGLRFMRFYGDSLPEFREFELDYYRKRFFILFSVTLYVFVLMTLSLYLGTSFLPQIIFLILPVVFVVVKRFINHIRGKYP